MLNIRELSFCQILVFSFLAQVPDEFREARRDVLHKLGSSFCSVSPLLSLPSPDGEHGVYYFLERVDIRLISLDRRKISTFLAGVIPGTFAVRF